MENSDPKALASALLAGCDRYRHLAQEVEWRASKDDAGLAEAITRLRHHLAQAEALVDAIENGGTTR